MPKFLPPSHERVIQRALVMAATVHRAFSEQRPNAAEECHAVKLWLARLNLLDELESQEQELLDIPLGQLEERRTVKATWQCEGLAVLAWALNRFELPFYEEQVRPEQLLSPVYFLKDEALQLLSASQLRSTKEFYQLDDVVYPLHWRLVEYALRPRYMVFNDFAKKTWSGLMPNKKVRMLNGDLAIGGHAISEAPQADFIRMLSIVHERHRALNWLFGHDVIYSNVNVDT